MINRPRRAVSHDALFTQQLLSLPKRYLTTFPGIKRLGESLNNVLFERSLRLPANPNVLNPIDPMISTGAMNTTWQVNGLYLNQSYVGDKNDGPFPNFEGKGYMGFNTTSKKYEGFWIDSASTTMQLESGDVDETGKIWTMLSDVVCPQTGQPMKKRSVITLIDNDHNKIEMYFETPEGESKCMEINYTRI